MTKYALSGDRAENAERATATPGRDHPAIEIAGLRKAYGATDVLRGVDLSVASGTITAVLGASGSGKTTLLRLIAGFDGADAGRISIAGHRVDDGRRTVSSRRRGVGYVPQDSALFPHLTVAGNIAFGMPRHRRSRLPELVSLVGMDGYERRYPHQLSGGQQQRVALARALAREPQVVLMDEPFGALDAALRDTLRDDVARILADAGTTAILVTHDQDEALSLAHRIAYLQAGRVTAHATPRELYDCPPTPQIAAAIGTANVLDGELARGLVHCVLGVLRAPDAVSGLPAAPRPCRVLLRPENLRLSTDLEADGSSATVLQVRYHGHDALIDLHVGDAGHLPLTARVAGQNAPKPGQPVRITTIGNPHVWA
jgi:iron(III) transport system ATP-binding protein